MGKNLLTIIVVGVLAAALPELIVGSICGCAEGLCCKEFGICGTGAAYCGCGCLGGPCDAIVNPNNVSISDIVTDKFFDKIIHEADPGCAGRSFYTRQAFLDALVYFPLFGKQGSIDDSKHELAAFFAHATQDSYHFCYIEKKDGNYCDSENTEYPCVANKSYHGRGPLMLSWNYNYGPAGNSLFFNGLRNPEIVASDPVMSFAASMWLWTAKAQCIIPSGQGFGETIRALHKDECDGGNSDAVYARVNFYTEYCNSFGVAIGDNLSC